MFRSKIWEEYFCQREWEEIGKSGSMDYVEVYGIRLEDIKKS